MNIKKLKTTVLPVLLICAACNSTTTTPEPVTPVATSKTLSSSSVLSDSNSAVATETLPETSNTGSLEDKYNLNDYIQTNKVLEGIPYSGIDTYKVHFTSDGGPIFSIKATTQNAMEILWKKTAKKLLFDTFQLLNVVPETDGVSAKYYSRYSQLIETDINVTPTDGTTLNKTANLVQTVSLSMNKIANGYKIAGFTPVTVRQVEKNDMPYKIDKVSLDYGTTNLIINADKTLLPWPGISINNLIKKASVKVFISSKDISADDIAVLISIGTNQSQLTKNSDGSYSGDFDFPEFTTEKNSLVIELIDKTSLSKDTKYHGYTWIVPFVKAS